MDGGWDETECRLSVSVEGDSVVAAGGEGERFERVEASGRFRYGGAYLVRIDGPEHVTYSDIVRKARAQGPLMVTCETCESMDSVQVVATIRANGRATWIRPLPGERVINRKAYEAAVVAITDQQFEPAQGRQGPVSDYLVLRIRIVPETK
jgi:hypothetical protein